MLITELPPAGENRIIAAGLLRGETSSLSRAMQCATVGSCSLKDLARDSDAVVVFDERHAGQIDGSLAALWNEIHTDETAFIVLVPRGPSPQVDSHYGEPTSSFLCS